MLGVCGRDQGAWPEAFPRGGRLEAEPEKDGDGNAATRAERRQSAGRGQSVVGVIVQSSSQTGTPTLP